MIRKAQKDILVKGIEYGLSVTDACARAKVSREWYYEECRKSPAFANEVANAEINLKLRLVAQIQAASRMDWRAAGWLLERKWAKEYAATQKHELGEGFKDVASFFLNDFQTRGGPKTQ